MAFPSFHFLVERPQFWGLQRKSFGGDTGITAGRGNGFGLGLGTGFVVDGRQPLRFFRLSSIQRFVVDDPQP